MLNLITNLTRNTHSFTEDEKYAIETPYFPKKTISSGTRVRIIPTSSTPLHLPPRGNALRACTAWRPHSRSQRDTFTPARI